MATAKFNLTGNNETRKSFNALINKEHKSWMACVRTIEKNWGVIRSLANKDGIRKEDICVAYCVKHLEGGAKCLNGKLGYYHTNKETKQKEFIVRESWTPKQVFDYVVAAGRAQWAALQKAAKEAAKERK